MKKNILNSIEVSSGKVLSSDFILTRVEEVTGIMKKSTEAFYTFQKVSINKFLSSDLGLSSNNALNNQPKKGVIHRKKLNVIW